MNTKPWPKLSESLTAEISPRVCQSCGVHDDFADTEVQPWREHDDRDEKTSVVLWLCLTCSDRLIEPHPRLYSRISPWEPNPGSMDICSNCRLRQGARCTSALLIANGGPGLPLRFPKPSVMFIDYRAKNGARKGMSGHSYHGPVTCEGKEHIDPEGS